MAQQRRQQAAVAAAKAAADAKLAAASSVNQQQPQQQVAQCQPQCKLSANEVCRPVPQDTSTSASSPAFACTCRAGFQSALNSVGQRQCVEVQSYVILLRLLQIADQQVAYKRELQNKQSAEYKQLARVVRDHVKRAYMTSDLTRDRFVNADVLNFARSLSAGTGTGSGGGGSERLLSQATPTSGRQPVTVNTSQLDSLNAGIYVNLTIHLQLPISANEIQLDESMLKEELAKKLNMRQAAALAAAAAAAATATSTSAGNPLPSPGNSTMAAAAAAPINATSGAQQPPTTTDEPLPNPNALFLADVEQVHDLNECASASLNDCHEGAVCINEPGSYRCDCREYPDLNPLNPGRQCASELKSCDYCNNRGDCLRVPSLLQVSTQQQQVAAASSSNLTANGTPLPPLGNGRGQVFSTVCQCHRIYLGRRCEINGLRKYLHSSLG